MVEPDLPAFLDRRKRSIALEPAAVHNDALEVVRDDRSRDQVVAESGAEKHERAAELRAIADRIRGRMKRATEHIIAIGNDLTLAKERLGHGKFGEWLTAEFDWTDRTARNFMEVAELVRGKTEKISDLKPATLRLLSKLSTPGEIVQDVLADVEAGRPVHHHLLKKRVDQVRERQTPDQGRTAVRRGGGRGHEPTDTLSDSHERDLSRLKRVWVQACPSARAAFVEYIEPTNRPARHD